MKILSVIGTRPQYIKIKPFYDYCKINNIDHKVVDTMQHYSKNVSKDIIDDLEIKINYSMDPIITSEIGFISDCMANLEKIIKKENPNYVLVYGDTNSTFCAALVSYKLGIPIAHIEAGLRCGDNKVPEEVNRIFSDTISNLKFCPSQQSMSNLEDGICSGDLEYELLNNINPKINYLDHGIMTIHRQSNIDADKLRKILSFCAKIPRNIKFYVHHRTKPVLKSLEIPNNIMLKDPCDYSTMVNEMSCCGFIITDSGGIQKTAPFFGKKALIVREKIEWKETEESGYVKKCSFSKENIKWLLTNDLNRDKMFYINGDKTPSEIIYNTIMDSI